MKYQLFLVFTFALIFGVSPAFSQDETKLTYYVGVGPAIDGKISLYGINVSNELSFNLGKRTSLNPALTFYQSVKTISNFEDENLEKDNSSGLFTTATFRYDVLQTKKDFKISLAFGPSFQIGSENMLNVASFPDSETPIYVSETERYVRLGYTQQIAFDWKSKNENRRNSAIVSMSSFDGYWPWYLMATYRIGFKLK